MTELVELTAFEAAEKIADGKMRVREYVDACIERIQQFEDSIQAWTYFDPDYSRQQADRADEIRAEGRGIGPLHGIPVGLKDIIDTVDMPTENGTPIYEGRQPSEDAAIVSFLRQAGAIIMGKTVTTELAGFKPGKTRNPHNIEHSPGGSSSGSAASVASLMVPLAIGTQTGGSIIRPASYCGVYALKPSSGLIPRSNVLCQSPVLDTVGPFARSIEDIALAVDCLAFFDVRDVGNVLRSKPRLIKSVLEKPPVKPMFAYVKSPFLERAEDVSDITYEAMEELRDFLGDQCDEVDLPPSFGDGIDYQRKIHMADVATHFGPLMDKYPDQLSSIVMDQIEKGREISAVAYNHAVAYREVLNAGLEQIFERYDAVITPSTRGPAPEWMNSPGKPIFSALWTYIGVPALNLPILEADGLPVGVQLIGPRFDDGRLMRTGKWLADSVLSEQ